MSALAQRWRIGGYVQGVGFRPFIYRLAHQCHLTGWVRNNSGTVEIHTEGSADQLLAFREALFSVSPATARARLIDVIPTVLESTGAFLIGASLAEGGPPSAFPVDLFMCNDCLGEMQDPDARRYAYPFINCTQCGPRYTIIRRFPYDRCNTSLDHFVLCASCAVEYADPADRRFHAQPLACHQCGPQLSWEGRHGENLSRSAALTAAVSLLRRGGIVAVRGVGGYHLVCDASRQKTVLRLRARKRRPAKPFAIMVPWSGTDGLSEVEQVAEISAVHAKALCDRARPIVMAVKRPQALLAAALAPGLREIGVMLPSSPLHLELLRGFGGALVMTSGNFSGEPIVTSPEEARLRLGGIADAFLDHDRTIMRPAEDPVLRIVAGRARPMRLGRGTAPLEIALARPVNIPTLAVGANSKCAIALAWGHRVVISPHVGQPTTPRGRAVFARAVADLQDLCDVRAERIMHDAHPGFFSSQWAHRTGIAATPVWHHHAHASAMAGECPTQPLFLCFTWDGVGLGPDQSLWGGEALLGCPGSWRRVASFRPFRLPGGESAAREPWRSAAALCWESGTPWIDETFEATTLLKQAFDAGVNCPPTTAVGRLFDAAAALLGVCAHATYEGEAAMRLEALCQAPASPVALPLKQDDRGVWRCDWSPLVGDLLDHQTCPEAGAARFHASLAHALVGQAIAIRKESGVTRIGLAGGVFQNRVLTEHVQTLLLDNGFDLVIPELLPMNDAGICFGQIMEAAALDAQIN